MNNSIALWWSNKESSVSLDVNVFIGENSSKNYIEFGIKVRGDLKEKDNFVCLFLPFVINKRDVIDKVPQLKTNIALTKALFNDDISVESENITNVTVVKFNNKKENRNNFRYMSLSSNFEVKDVADATTNSVGKIIKIDIKNGHSSDEYDALYYRFRINNNLEKIVKDTTENYLFIDKLVKKIIYFDFNINKNDKLPNGIVEEFENFSNAIESQNIFLKTDMSMNIIFQSKEHQNIKVLADIWKEYIGVDEKSNVIIYQWKVKEIFLKLSYTQKSKVMFLLLFFGLFAFFNIALNVSSNFIYDSFKADTNSSKHR